MNTSILTDNATTVARLYAAFGKGDIPFIVSHIDDKCHWIGAGKGYLPQGGIYAGKGAVQFFAKLNEAVDFKSFI